MFDFTGMPIENISLSPGNDLIKIELYLGECPKEENEIQKAKRLSEIYEEIESNYLHLNYRCY